MVKCSICEKEGHNARSCTERGGGSGPRKPRAAAAPLATVTSADIGSVKTAVVGVIDALEGIDPAHHARVIRSAMLILGDDPE